MLWMHLFWLVLVDASVMCKKQIRVAAPLIQFYSTEGEKCLRRMINVIYMFPGHQHILWYSDSV